LKSRVTFTLRRLRRGSPSREVAKSRNWDSQARQGAANRDFAIWRSHDLPREREAGRVGRAGVVPSCAIHRCMTRASNAPRIRPLFPDWIRTCSAHLDGNQQGALGPSSPDFTGSARQDPPIDPGPCGFMPRRQCGRRSSCRPVEGVFLTSLPKPWT
jgi:hypothetical protein